MWNGRKNNMMDQSFMKTKPVLPLVVSMSMPMVLSMLVNALYNIVDSFFIARISEDAMTALSLVFPLQNIAGAVCIGFGVGVNAAVAFYLGAGRQKDADGAASLGVLLSLVHAVLLTIALSLAARPFLQAFTDDPAVLDYGMRYARIVIVFSVINQVSLVYEKLFQAIGSMKVSMASMMAGCIVNVILDPVMIFGFGPIPAMSIEGAAYATIIGQAVTLAVYLVLWKKGRLHLHISLRDGWESRRFTGRLYNVGIPATLNQALPSILISMLNGILAGYSQTGILILGIYYKLQTFIYLTANGIVQGIRPLVAYNYGAGEEKRVGSIFRTALGMALAVMGVGTVICVFAPEWCIGLFTGNPETILQGAAALRIISAGFLISAVSVTAAGTLEGLGMGGASFIISLLRYLVVILPAAYLLSRAFGMNGVWMAFPAAEFLSAGAAIVLYRRVRRKSPTTR